MFALKGYMFICIFGSAVFLVAAGGTHPCVDENKPKMDSCLDSFTQLLQAATSNASVNASTSGTASSSLIEAMCSDESKAAMRCIVQALTACPQLAQGSENPILTRIGVSSVMKAGGMDIFCSMIGVGDNTDGGACVARIKDCMPESVPDMTKTKYMDMAVVDGKFLPFISFQHTTGMLCGPMKSFIKCFMDLAEECSSIDVEGLRKQLVDMIKQQDPDLQKIRVMTFEEQQNFVEEGCNHVPKDFAKDACVTKELMSANFSECHSAFTHEYPDKAARGDCKAYTALKGCFADHVGKCGARQAAFMAKYSPLMVAGLDDSCEDSGTTKKPASAGVNQTPDSAGAMVTSTVVMTIVFLILGLLL